MRIAKLLLAFAVGSWSYLPGATWADGLLGLDAVINWDNGKAYFFNGNQYIRYDIQADKADPNYPAAIDKNWHGLWTDGIDAAINWGNGKTYFFKGDQYIRYYIQADKADPGYPTTITNSNWPGLWTDGIDAAINWGNGKAYFFKENQYIRYDIAADKADAGYPTTMTDQNWPGISFDGEVSSVWSTNWNRLYLIQNDSYVTGHYVYYDKGELVSGQIEGTLTGNLLKGWWKESDQPSCGPNKAWDGPVTFRFAEDGTSFVGDWGECSDTPDTVNPSDNTWNGSLLEGVFNINKLVERFSIWSTNWDRLYLIQKGALVKGHYIYYEKGQPIYGQIEGAMENLVFNGWWKQSNQPNCGPDNAWDGPVTFVFAKEGKSFFGDWGGCSKTFESLSPSNKSWHGTFVEGQFQVKKLATEHSSFSSTQEDEQTSEAEEPTEVDDEKPTEVEVDDEKPTEAEVSSEWKTNWDKLSLTQQGSSITGRYSYNTSHGDVIGTLKGLMLKGWWRQSSQPHCGPAQAWDGPFTFLFAEDGKSFVGDWGGCTETLKNMKPSRDKTWNGTLVKGVFNLSNVPDAVVEESPADTIVPAEKASDESSATTSADEDADSTVLNDGVVALGCFKDKGDPSGTTGRDLDGLMWSDSQMTTEKCLQHCQEYNYAGTQYSFQCFCGNNYGRYGKASNCNSPCKGNAKQTCGGTWANNVYQIVKPQCFWMENSSGEFKWLPASKVYRKELTKHECLKFDSCDGGEGLSGGGCYKWATSPDAPRIPW